MVRPGDAKGIAKRIEGDLRRAGSEERAEGARRYLKSRLVFFGADARAVRESVGSSLRDAATLDRKGLLALADALWTRGVFDLRAAAVVALEARAQLLSSGDIVSVERMIREASTWALVDTLAIHVGGPLVVRFAALGDVLDCWACDDDFWVRRAAMLTLLVPLRRGSGDFGRFSRYADDMLEEKEFFIRKAIGWVLREVGKKRPRLVSDWLAPRTHRASGVTVREAVRYLPERQRGALLAAYRERRPLSRVDGEMEA